MRNLKGLRTLSWPTGSNLHEGTEDIKVFSLTQDSRCPCAIPNIYLSQKTKLSLCQPIRMEFFLVNRYNIKFFPPLDRRYLFQIDLTYSNIYPTRCNVTLFILSGNCSTCFGWYHHTSSGAQTTVSTVSGICHTVNVICRYRGRVGTDLSVLWVAYAI